jgi:hypothetical protein
MAQRWALAGLIPFALGTALAWMVGPQALPYVVLGLSSWAGVVLAFIGALYWGVGMVKGELPPAVWAWGTLPAFVAALAVMMPPSSGLVIHGVLLVVCYAVDRQLYPRLGLQAWLTLRFRLTVVTSLCCFLGAAAA